MKFYSKKRRAPSVIIVSLIDILAILLIFFVVTATFKKDQPQLQINLPESTSAEKSTEAKTEPILLAVKSGDTITLDSKHITLDELPTALKEAREKNPSRTIAMQADKEAPFGVVVKVLDALKEAGIKNVPAFTAPQPANP